MRTLGPPRDHAEMPALRTTRPKPDAVRTGVRQILTELSFRAAAERVRTEMAPHDAGLEGAVLLERLAESGAPVTTPVPPMGAERPRVR